MCVCLLVCVGAVFVCFFPDLQVLEAKMTIPKPPTPRQFTTAPRVSGLRLWGVWKRPQFESALLSDAVGGLLRLHSLSTGWLLS